MLRSARIEPGTVAAITAGLPLSPASEFDEGSRIPQGQLEVRSGRPAADSSWGMSAGVIIPWYLGGTALDVYWERPRRKSNAMGFGIQLGASPAVYHLVSFPLDTASEAEFSVGNRFLVSLFKPESGVFVSYDVTLGLHIPLTRRLKAHVGYSHFFVPGSFRFNSAEDPVRVLGDIDMLTFGISWTGFRMPRLEPLLLR